jgi:hypothetical protein
MEVKNTLQIESLCGIEGNTNEGIFTFSKLILLSTADGTKRFITKQKFH